ncbi:uracil-DNA glycosylase family protein (plasmid) [Pseudoalteromonas sp. T1lg65]|uniref:uracil-DNA glycosylase family protein n=1 Tax=Pseudoalteromonas sp. T1lg65 TaxID=2077101 RepID=UPI003F7A8D66
MTNIFTEVKNCSLCQDSLPKPPNPVVQLNKHAKILIIGQAPGRMAHDNSKPFSDASGERLRGWLGVSEEVFYNPLNFAIMPMSFCYPGKGSSGDLPPLKRCAPHWHARLNAELKMAELTLLVGQYAQRYYLPNYQGVTHAVRNEGSAQKQLLCVPHPSPRNHFWVRKNTWFETDVLPRLQTRVKEVLNF